MTKHYLIKYETTGQERTIIEGEIIDPHGIEQERYYFNGQFKGREIVTGLTTKFHSNGSVSFRGNVENGIRQGKGTSYDENGKIVFKGLYDQHQRSEGTLFKGGIESFVGEFRNGRPWNGKVINYNFYQEKVKEFTGKIREGSPYSGTGYRFKRDEAGFDLADKIHHENWEPDDDMIEQQEMHDHEYTNQNIRKEYSDWEDYIIVDLKEGEAHEREDIEENIKVFHDEDKRR